LPFPQGLDGPILLQVVLALAWKIMPAQIAAKLLIFGSLFVAAWTAYKASPVNGFVPRSIASLIYVLNPFVYGRLQYGQLFLLAGYAVLPWVAVCIRHVLLKPGWATGGVAAISLTLLAMLDVHMLVPASVLTAALLITHTAKRCQTLAYLRRVSRALLITIAVTSLANIYWLLPFITGRSAEGKVVANITEVDLQGFQTVADPHLGIVINVLGLYGFWGEATYRFSSMKVFVPLWPVVLAGLILLAVIGTLGVIYARPKLAFEHATEWVTGLLLAGTAATILEIGIADPHIAPAIRWLDANVSPYRGMRDAGKWAALLALVYSQLVPLGVVALTGWVYRVATTDRRGLAEGAIVAIGLSLPLYYGNGLLFGMHGQILPSAYPSGWYAADRVLAADHGGGRAVFLPWHQYLSLSFVKNANRVIAAPAPYFFSIPVVTSSNPEYPPISHPEDADQLTLSALVAAGGQADWAPQLADRNIEYVLLAREVDWLRYSYLSQQPGLDLVGDYGPILLYRNTLWSPVSAIHAQRLRAEAYRRSSELPKVSCRGRANSSRVERMRPASADRPRCNARSWLAVKGSPVRPMVVDVGFFRHFRMAERG
jgi:hypothetical protein